MKQMPVYLNEYRFPKIKERLPYLDMMKGIAMILVMLSHISIAKETAIVFKPFFLPVFFVASGYTFHIKNTFSQFLWNKVKTLLFPAFLLSLLQIALSCILTFTEQDPLPVQLTALLLQNGGQGSKMWFVFALFVCCIPFYFMVRLIDRTFFFIVLSVAGLILGLSYNYIGGGHFALVSSFGRHRVLLDGSGISVESLLPVPWRAHHKSLQNGNLPCTDISCRVCARCYASYYAMEGFTGLPSGF